MTMVMMGAAALMLWTGAQAAMGPAAGQTTPAAPMAGMAMPAQAAPACPATPAPLPAEYAGWAAMSPLAAGASAGVAAALPLGSSAAVTLGDATAVGYAAAPEHKPAPGTHGGLLSLTVTAPGRYRIALGAGAWIDLVQGTAALHSIGHGHGPACTTLKKYVDFDLQPGRYLIQLSGSAAPTLGVMAMRMAA